MFWRRKPEKDQNLNNAQNNVDTAMSRATRQGASYVLEEARKMERAEFEKNYSKIPLLYFKPSKNHDLLNLSADPEFVRRYNKVFSDMSPDFIRDAQNKLLTPFYLECYNYDLKLENKDDPNRRGLLTEEEDKFFQNYKQNDYELGALNTLCLILYDVLGVYDIIEDKELFPSVFSDADDLTQTKQMAEKLKHKYGFVQDTYSSGGRTK